ncbi:MAG TPA: hypothetical protein P5077_08865 [bacterium]|nr:hypothetical protein [bacterium]
MILVTFATPPENPFDIPLVKGAATPHDDLLLVLAGIGSPGAARIDDILQSRPEIRGLLEFGGAAAVANAPIGAHYTVTRLFSTDGNGIGSIEPVPGLPRAAATGGDTVYRGDDLPWADTVGAPLLYTMETLSLFDICRRRRLPFRSIRLVTDNGVGEISRRYRTVLAAHRDENATLIRDAASLLAAAPRDRG